VTAAAASWSGARALVTGAGGFIGSHLVERLAREGADVVAFTRYTSQSKRGLLEMVPAEILEKVQVIRGDIRDADAVESAVRGADYVFHLAALVGIPYSFLHPTEVFDVNTMGTLNVLNAARGSSPQRVVITSTSEVYGTARYVPIDEKHPLQAQSPYAASKIGSDAAGISFFRAYGLPVVVVRPFNAFGPRQSDRAVIPTIIAQALTKDRVRLGNLDATRDFTFVTDTVAGFLAAASASVYGRPLNIGSGFEISIGEVAQRIIALTGSAAPLEVDAERLRPEGGEVDRLWCDSTLARELLGWQPEVSLDEGLQKAIAWVSEFRDLYTPDRYAI